MMRNIVFLIASIAVGIAAASESVEQTERDFGRALSSNDLAALDNLLAGDLVYTHSTGNTDTKASYLESLKSGNQKYLLFDYQSLDAKSYGDTAIVYGVVHVKSVTKGAPSESHLKIIHVWMKKDSGWKLVAHQSLRLAA